MVSTLRFVFGVSRDGSHSTLCRFSSLSRNTFPMQDSENMEKNNPPMLVLFMTPFRFLQL